MAKSNDTALQLKQLKTDLSSQSYRPLYVFHGEETYLKDYYTEQLKTALISPEFEAFNLHILEGKDLQVRRLTELLDLYPFMSEKSLIILRNFDPFKAPEEERKALTTLLASIPPHCCLLFHFQHIDYKPDGRMKALSAVFKDHALVVEFARQSKSALHSWVSRRFRALGHEIAPAELEYLLFLCGDLMQGLIPEIEKISAYATEVRITKDDIDAVATPIVEAAVFELTNALLNTRSEQPFVILSKLFTLQESPIFLLAVLGKQFRQLLTARLILDTRAPTSELASLWGFRSNYPAERLLTAARRYTIADCQTALGLCAEADLALKSHSAAEGEGIFIDLLLKLGAERAAS